MDAKNVGRGCLGWIIIIIVGILCIESCQSKNNKASSSPKTDSETSVPGDSSEAEYQREKADQEERDRALVCSLLCRSLKELYSFRYDDEFHKVGFGVGGKYNAWLKNIEKIRDRSSSLPNRFFAVKTAAGEIMQAGFEFMKSGGFDTEYTKTILPNVEQAIGYKDYLRRIAEIEAQMQK